MPNGTSQPVTGRYYPTLSSVISQDDIPEILGFLKGGILWIFDKVHYKDLQYSKSPKGDSAFYSLSIVSADRLDIELFGTGIFLVLNPDVDDNTISSFPITIEYKWKILAYLRAFDMKNFSYSPQAFFELALRVLNITEEQALAQFINTFVVPDDENITPLQQFVTDINDYLESNIPAPTDETRLSDIVQQIYTESGSQYGSVIAFGTYLLTNDVNQTMNNIKRYYQAFVPQDIEGFIKDIVVPKFKATLTLSAGVEFPRSMLIPVYPEGTIIGGEDVSYQPMPEPARAMFTFAEAFFYADSTQGFGYNMDLVINTVSPVQIGNTGLILNIQNLKIDLSTTTNFPEATADGLPNDFIGVYVGEGTITFPTFWNQNDGDSSGQLKVRNLLVGTGGISGTIGLEAKTEGDPAPLIKANFGGGFSISLDAFDITFQQNAIISSNIHGTMKIPGFKDTTGEDAEINIDVWIGTNGEFSVTASEDQGITALRIPGIVDVTVKSLSIGRKGGRFYVAVSGALEFQDMGDFIGQFLPDKLEIQKLLIWQDGQMEYEGGTLVLPNAVTLKIGPVTLSVTAIGFGSHEQQHEGQLRKYRFFEFSGGISVKPGGIDARGDGIKLYYTVDNDASAGRNPHHYIQIQGMSINIVLPGSTSPANAALLLNGYLSMKDPKPGNEQAGSEYTGGVTFSMPPFDLKGSAAMRLNPRMPSFIVDAEMHLSSPIFLGSTGLGIYGLRGLIGQRYVASKTAAGVQEDAPWWQYYKAKIAPDYQEGVQLSKFDQTPGFSFGAGVSLATVMDGGRVFSSKLFFLLSLPEVFLLQGQAQILKDRIGLDTPDDPPFFALLSISKTSIEAAFGVDYQIPDDERPGSIARVNALIEMGFFFGNSSAWYLNIGKDLPETRRVNARVLELFDAYFYLMLSSAGIRAGAGAKFEFNKKFGPLRAELGAYLDVAGKIAFKPKQYGASIQLGGKVGLYIFKFGFAISVDAGLAGEAPKPFIVTGKLKACIQILKKNFCAKFEFTWVKNTALDTGQITLMNREAGAKAMNIITQETFELYTSAGTLSALTPSVIENYTVPMDSYIDLEFLKGVLPSTAVKSAFGGHTQGASYVDYVAPQKAKSSRVRHEYRLDEVNIYTWNGTSWVGYDLYEAATPLADAPFVTSELDDLKKGFWQYQQANVHNRLRILAQSPLSFVSQGSGNLIVEELGITSETIFCPPAPVTKTCIDFNVYGRKPPIGEVHTSIPSGQVIAVNGLLVRINGQPATISYYPNSGFLNALTLQPGSELEVLFPDEVSLISLRLKTVAPQVKIYYYQRVETGLTPGNLPQFDYTLVETKDIPYEDLTDPVIYDDATHPIDRIIVESCTCNPSRDPLICTADITQQAKDLLVFLTTVFSGGYTFPLSLYPKYDAVFKGIFQGSSLYPKITDKDTELTLSVLTSTPTSITLSITDNFGFSCQITLTSRTSVKWEQLVELSDLQPYQPEIGENFRFVINRARFKNGTILKITGESCYPVNECTDTCSLRLYQLCYLKFDDAQYNATLPNHTDVQQEVNVLTEGFNKSIQPVWRPNTYYAIEVKTEDKLFKDGSSTVITNYPNSYLFGFKTKGPAGFFHQGNPTYEQLLSQDREAEFKLTNLQYYIDYEKSYPNADGALIHAKPLFYLAPKLTLFYLKNYVYEFYRNWDEYQNNEAVQIELVTLLADPAPDTTLPPATLIPVNWQADNLPGFVQDAELLDNMIENGQPCVDTTAITPMGVHSEVTTDRLEPLKLYTAIFKARYKTASQSEYAEEEVHRYVFQTSRYGSFEEQVNSYVLERDEENPLLITKEARFEVRVQLASNQLATAQAIMNDTLDADSPLRQDYAYDYDKLISGIFKLGALHPAMTTEFNLIKEETTGTLLGVLLRSPEPFNDPKISDTDVAGTITAETGNNQLDRKLYSKDRRNVFITNSALTVTTGSYDFVFKYLQWSGAQYDVKDTVSVSIDLIFE